MATQGHGFEGCGVREMTLAERVFGRNRIGGCETFREWFNEAHDPFVCCSECHAVLSCAEHDIGNLPNNLDRLKNSDGDYIEVCRPALQSLHHKGVA